MAGWIFLPGLALCGGLSMVLRHMCSVLACVLVSGGVLWSDADPLDAPEDFRRSIRKSTFFQSSSQAKLQAVLGRLFNLESQGGMGICYDNTRTRSVEEALRERKGNCLSLSAAVVEACDAAGLKARFAEAQIVGNRTQSGALVHQERHLVAVVSLAQRGDIVVDGARVSDAAAYKLTWTSRDKVRALYYSNLAVGALDQGKSREAYSLVMKSLKTEPGTGIAWNVLGVVFRKAGHRKEAEDAFRQALKMENTNRAAMSNLADLLEEQGKHGEANVYRDRLSQAAFS